MSNRLHELAEGGWEITYTGADHIRLTHPCVKGYIITSKTPGDHRSWKNARALMRRALVAGAVPKYIERNKAP